MIKFHQYYKGYPVRNYAGMFGGIISGLGIVPKGVPMDWKGLLKRIALVLWPVVVTVVNGLLGVV